MNEAILTTRNLEIGYRLPRRESRAVAKDINIALHRGELVCLLGPNGAGKSTLMRTLCAMQPALGGTVELDGADVFTVSPKERARRLAVVLTERVSAGLLDAYTLVSLGRHPHTGWTGRLTPTDHDVIRWALEATGAAEFAQRHIGDLSDGERQRVMMARALAQEPSVMILDEFTAFLDLPLRVEMMRLLRSLARQTNRAILLSTHDLDFALRTADQVWLLPKDGKLHAGLPEGLVLDGSFQKAFESEGVTFEANKGAFRVHEPHDRAIVVKGEPLGAFWTARALERHGYQVLTDGATNASVHVEQRDAHLRWRLALPGETREFAALGELLRSVGPAETSYRSER
jgi:iron complex transport system ATP-binding protein